MFSLLSFVVTLAILAFFLFLAARIVGNNTPYGKFFLIALIGSACSAIPFAGFLVGLIVVLVMLVNLAKMSWPAAIVTVFLSYILAFVITFVIALVLGLAAGATSSGASGAVIALF